MIDTDGIALAAAYKIEDVFCQSHHSRVQRVARIQIVIGEALEQVATRRSRSDAADSLGYLYAGMRSRRGKSDAPAVSEFFRKLADDMAGKKREPDGLPDQITAWWAETGTSGVGEGCNKPFWLKHDATDYVQRHGGYVRPLYTKFRSDENLSPAVVPTPDQAVPGQGLSSAKAPDSSGVGAAPAGNAVRPPQPIPEPGITGSKPSLVLRDEIAGAELGVPLAEKELPQPIPGSWFAGSSEPSVAEEILAMSAQMSSEELAKFIESGKETFAKEWVDRLKDVKLEDGMIFALDLGVERTGFYAGIPAPVTVPIEEVIEQTLRSGDDPASSPAPLAEPLDPESAGGDLNKVPASPETGIILAPGDRVLMNGELHVIGWVSEDSMMAEIVTPPSLDPEPASGDNNKDAPEPAVVDEQPAALTSVQDEAEVIQGEDRKAQKCEGLAGPEQAGVGVIADPRNSSRPSVKAKAPAGVRTAAPAAKKPIPKALAIMATPDQVDWVLNLWNTTNIERSEIAAKVKINPSMVNTILSSARKRGDRRSFSRPAVPTMTTKKDPLRPEERPKPSQAVAAKPAPVAPPDLSVAAPATDSRPGIPHNHILSFSDAGSRVIGPIGVWSTNEGTVRMLAVMNDGKVHDLAEMSVLGGWTSVASFRERITFIKEKLENIGIRFMVKDLTCRIEKAR